MTKTATKTYLVGVIERAIGYFEVDAENWQDGEFCDRDDEALEAEGPCNVREKPPDGRFLKLPRSQSEALPIAGSDVRRRRDSESKRPATYGSASAPAQISLGKSIG